MTDFGIYTKNADIQAFAGVNAGATEKAIAATDIYVLNVEGMIDTDCLFDYSAAYTAGSLNTTFRRTLTMAGASKCAQIVVNANLTGYSARERETTLDFLNLIYDAAMKLLRDADHKALIKDET